MACWNVGGWSKGLAGLVVNDDDIYEGYMSA